MKQRPRCRLPDDYATVTVAPEQLTRLSGTARVETFSDGVMAIAITLLILDVRLPDDGGGLLHQLGKLWPAYLGYADSFFTIGVIWLCHHSFFGRIRHVDGLLQWGNLALLMTVAFIPFSTSVLSAHIASGGWDARIAAAFYGAVATLQAAAWLIMWAALRRRPALLEHGYDATFARVESRMGWLGVVIFGCCALLGLLTPIVSLGAYVLAVAGYGITSNGWHHTARHANYAMSALR
jgi:uncharacterized membrane protein